MRILLSLILFFSVTCNSFSFVQASETSRQQCLELIENFPKLTNVQENYTKGEIQIVVDPQERVSIENDFTRDIGVVMRDKYWLWIQSLKEVAVMQGTVEGIVILNCSFPHAICSSQVSIPPKKRPSKRLEC